MTLLRRVMARLLAGTAVLVVVSAPPATAHERREVGDHEVVVGWLDEPAFAGFKNAVQLVASHQNGEPVSGATLEVEVIFGEANADERTDPMPLEPAFGSPGEYHAVLIPTRPGTYSFHVFGRLERGEEFDETFTSGEQTFGDVEEPTRVAFPVQDPTAGELSEALTRLQERLESATDELAGAREDFVAARSDAEAAGDTATLARILAIIALAISIGAVAWLAVRRRRRPSSP